jgi:hypothetical protein
MEQVLGFNLLMAVVTGKLFSGSQGLLGFYGKFIVSHCCSPVMD